jgi:hypothetical protein
MYMKSRNVTLVNRLLQVQLLAALAVLPAIAQISSTPVAPQTTTISRHQHAPIKIREHREDGSWTSENWSGYAVTGSNVTDAKGSWIVPSVTCPSSADQWSSFWVGIDGFSSNTVEQIGTDSDCVGTAQSYYVWYEFYPHPSYTINSLTIKPGDTISAEVSYSSKTKKFTVTLSVNGGTPFSVSTSVSSAKRSSAEWIAEAPSGGGILPLADFNYVDFGGDYTGKTNANTCDATIGGTTSAFGLFPSANVQNITMVNSSGTPEATPSAVSKDGTSFRVTVP